MGSFVGRMNDKARELGMLDTRYVEPTGLSSDNRSTAQDLVRLVKAAVQHPLLRELSTTVDAVMPVGRRHVQFQTTNGLVRNPDWEIGLQKTGYIAAAGRCVVMQAQFAGRQLIMVLLDSAGRYSRIGDAERIRHWLGAKPVDGTGRLGPCHRGAGPGRRCRHGAASHHTLKPRCAPLGSGAPVQSQAVGRWPSAAEICEAVSRTRPSQDSSSRSAGADTDKPATSRP
jgi:hypothetical protein